MNGPAKVFGFAGLVLFVTLCLAGGHRAEGNGNGNGNGNANGNGNNNNGNGNSRSGNGQVEDSNGHDDQWHVLSQTEQSFILHAYFVGNRLPQNIKSCERVEECPAAGSGVRCDNTWKLCISKDSNNFYFPPTDGVCGRHEDCKPMYRCGNNNKCQLTGPVACREQADCLVIPQVEFSCVEIPEQMPGKRCWRKCVALHECLECDDQTVDTAATNSTCRIPLPFRNTVTCQDGYCLKNPSSS